MKINYNGKILYCNDEIKNVTGYDKIDVID